MIFLFGIFSKQRKNYFDLHDSAAAASKRKHENIPETGKDSHSTLPSTSFQADAELEKLSGLAGNSHNESGSDEAGKFFSFNFLMAPPRDEPRKRKNVEKQT